MKHLKLALFLSFLSMIGFLAGIPYTMATIGEQLAMAPLPIPVMLMLTVIQGTVVTFLLSWAGLSMAKSVGVGAPIFRKWVYKEEGPSFTKQNVLQAVVFGLLGTGSIIVLELFIFRPLIPVLAQKEVHVSFLAGMLTAIQGGVFEEVMLRLFLMTLIVWVLRKLFGGKSEAKPWMYWIGIIFAAIIFGAAHLPFAHTIFGEITPLLFVRTIVSNGIAGILFGYLYWKKGLEYAIIAHAIGDILIHGFFG